MPRGKRKREKKNESEDELYGHKEKKKESERAVGRRKNEKLMFTRPAGLVKLK